MIIFPYMVARQSTLSGVTKEEHKIILSFRKRVEELHLTKERDNRIPVSRTTYDELGAVASYDANVPDVDTILLLATRFRHFFAQKEKLHFETFINSVKRRATDQWASNYLDNIKLCYIAALHSDDTSAALGLAIPNSEVITLWFNSEFFHSDESKRERLDDVNERISVKGSLFQLYVGIRRCVCEIDRLYSVLYKFDEDHQYIYTPNHHFESSSRQSKVNGKVGN